MQSCAADTVRSRMVGAWQLADHSAFLALDESDKTYPMGTDSSAILLYTPDGYMSTQILGPKPDSSAASSPSGSGSSARATNNNYMAYTGRFDLHVKQGDRSVEVVHHLDQTNLSALLGSEQKRAVKFFEDDSGQFLELLTLDPIEFDGQQRLVRATWKKLPHNLSSKE